MTITTIQTDRSSRRRGTMALLGYLVALMAVGLVLLVAAGGPARASTTFTVNSASDSSDGFCNAQHCTLREAIAVANATPNSGGPDLIRFNIGGEGTHTISPTSPLPTISSPVVIDGYTQPGASPNALARGTNAELTIELDGENAGNLVSGLEIGNRLFDASGTVVRGLVINRFDGNGIEINAPATGVKIEGNFIGTDSSGLVDLGNGQDGVDINGASGNTVGGSTPEARNLISGNGAHGVILFDASANKVQGNLIGTKRGGTGDLGNSLAGVDFFKTGTHNNLIGGVKPAQANVIAFNGQDGVKVEAFSGGAPVGNRILRNSIFSNAGLGIDLVGPNEDGSTDVLTENDRGDQDEGPNALQNKPIIRSATTADGKTTIRGSLGSKPNQSYVLRFFSNPKGNEGKAFIGEKKASTDSDGKASFTFSPARRVGVGKTITATATDASGNTSEFSAPKEVVAS